MVLAWLAIVVNVGAALVWVWSRAIGLPFAPEPGRTEAVGSLDIVASTMELVLASLVAALTVDRTRTIFTRLVLPARSAWLGGLFWSGLIIAVTPAALLTPQYVGH